MWKTIVFCAVLCLAAAEQATFENYKVFRITPNTENQVEVLQQLQEISDGFSYWDEPTSVGKHADLMVAPHKLSEFHDMMKQADVPYETYMEDVQAVIDQQKSLARARSFDFKSYHTLDEIYQHLDNLAKEYPGKIQVIVGGRTHEGRQIKGIKLSFKNNNPGVFIEGGIHAREWISPATVLYIVDQLLKSNNTDVRALAESHDWYVFPNFNPDGYVFTHTTNRIWRKTRKPHRYPCVGTDLNRNWGYKWMSGGASNNPCADTYAGASAFSEVESKTMSEYIKRISDKFYAYIAFHSYSQLLLLPYGHTTAHLDNYDDLLAIGKQSIAALKRRYGTSYETGNIAETIYVASGGSMDWVKANFHQPITYTYELRDRGRYGFLLPPEQIIPTGEETLDSLVTMFKESKARGYPN